VEVVAARINIGRYASVIVVVYRPRSYAIQLIFYDEMSMVFEAVATYQMPVHVIGDFNIRFDRPDDSNAHHYWI